MLTRRGASLLLAIALFSFIGWVSGSPIFAITSLTLVLLVLIESLQLKFVLHVVKKLEIRRSIVDSKLEVGRGTDVSLRLLNPTRRSAACISITDQIPEALVVTTGNPTSMVQIKSNQEVSLRYSINAIQIGEYDIRGVSASAADPLGFATFTVFLPLISRLEVYPRLRPMRLFRVRGVSQILSRNFMGQKATSRSGPGSDFRGIREYYAGDDFKHIAWKTVAKSPRHLLMTKEFEPDRSLNLVLSLQAKKSMLDGPVGRRKLDYAIEAIVIMAYAASLESDRLVFNFGNRCERLIIPGRGRQRQLVQALRSTYNILPTGSEPLETAVGSLARELRDRSIIVVITDSEQDAPEELDALRRLVPDHHVQVVAMKTTSLFEKPNLAEARIKMGYAFVTAHEERALQQMRERCWRLGFPLKVCDANEISRVLYEIYLGGKSGMIAA